MSLNEINGLVNEVWFVLSKNDLVSFHYSEPMAKKKAAMLDESLPKAAPHRIVQLQVKGTLPEGAIMPKYKVGDRVGVSLGTRPYIVGSIEAAYRLEGAFGTYGDEHLSPIPPADPMRDEFEALAAKQKCDISRLKDQSDTYTNIYTQGMWDGYKAAKAGAK